MENKFYEEDDFTQFLKDSTEDFKMYPGRRVWHSLYKDMHPSQKWPSVAVCLLLIGSIVYLGIANNNSINKNSAITITERKVPANSPILAKETAKQKSNDDYVANNGKSSNISQDKFYPTSESPIAASTSVAVKTNDLLVEDKETSAPVYDAQNGFKNNTSSKLVEKIIAIQKKPISSNSNKEVANLAKIVEFNSVADAAEKQEEQSTSSESKPLVLLSANAERSFMDDDVFNNLKRKSEFKTRTSLNYYVTPSVGFRTLKQKTIPPFSNQATATPLSTTAPSQQGNINDKVTQSYAINMEAGAGMNYNLTKKIAVTAGIQFNYTNYVSYANSLQHTEAADLYLISANGNFEQERASSFANTVNSNYAVLNNTTIQFSVPIGLEYSVIEGRKLNWKVGAAIQPGIIASGKGYVLSSDNTHYIEDRSLLSNTILNSSIQTTISYRTTNGVTIFAGPQLRYQLTDTHKSRYNYSERLYNYGIKIGLSRNL